MTPYLVLAVALFVFGIIVRYSPLPELDPSVVNKRSEADESSQKDHSISSTHFRRHCHVFHIGTQMIALGTPSNTPEQWERV